jgi:hypothetical protein
VSANPHTASLLIKFSGDIDSLEAEAAQCGLFSLQRAKPAEVVARPVVSAKAEARAGSITPTELGLTGLGFYQITRGHSLGSASEIFWNAYGAYRILERPGLALLLCGLGVWQTLRGEWLGPASALLFYALVARKLSEAEPAAAPEREPGLR